MPDTRETILAFIEQRATRLEQRGDKAAAVVLRALAGDIRAELDVA